MSICCHFYTNYLKKRENIFFCLTFNLNECYLFEVRITQYLVNAKKKKKKRKSYLRDFVLLPWTPDF